jgi:L-ascorbate metabolism protein UlaG (beta-lactamase superfamily)
MVISITWLGHASFKLESEGKIIYIDPYTGNYDDKADLILITHSHFDHCDPVKVKLIQKDGGTIIAPPDCIKKIGSKITSLRVDEIISIGNIEIKAVKAYNYKRFKAPKKPFHPKNLGVGYLIKLQEKIIYHTGDTDFIPEMKKLKNIYLALIPSGGTYTMDNKEAAEATLSIKPRFVIPMHVWDKDPKEFKRLVEEKAESEIKVIISKTGEKIKLS